MTAAPDATSPASQVGDQSPEHEAAKAFMRSEMGFDGPHEQDTPLQAAAREAGWALSEMIDSAPWEKRGQLQAIVGRLAVSVDASQPVMSEANAPIPAVQSGAVAWLLEWRDEREEPHDRRRVQLSPALDLWMKPYEVKITALGVLAAPQSEPLPGGVGEAVDRLIYFSEALREHHEATLDLQVLAHDCETHHNDIRAVLKALAALSGKEQG